MSRAAPDRPLAFERFPEEKGPSESIVTCLLLDRHGYLWLGTEDGLNRYDGYEFRVFRHSNDDPHSLVYSEVQCLLETRAGELWVGTFGGLDRFDPERERFEHFVPRPAPGPRPEPDPIPALAEDPSGDLWVGTGRGGLGRLHPVDGSWRRLRHDPRDPASLADDRVRALLVEPDGRLWAGTAAGLDELAPGSPELRHHRHDPDDPGSLVHPGVEALHRDGRGRLWVGTRGGLDRLDRASGRFVHVPVGAGGLAHPHVRALADGDGDLLWVALDGGGIDLLDPDSGAVVHHRHDPHDAETLATDRVFSCCRDRSGQLWVGTYGGGLHKTDPRKRRFGHHAFRPGDRHSLAHPIVWSIQEEEDVLWVGTDGGLDRIDRATGEVRHLPADPDDPAGLVHPGVRVVYAGPSGSLWVGTNGGLQRLDRATGRLERWLPDPGDPHGLRHPEIRSLWEDADGDLWIGTLGGGLHRFTPPAPEPAGGLRPGRFEVWGAGPPGSRVDDPRFLGSDYVRPILEDRRGRLWIGTQGGGLACLDRATGRWRHLRHDPDDPASISSDHVFALWEDRGGSLWIGTYAGGLDRLDPEFGRVRRWGVAHGLPANLIYGLLGDDEGCLWLSSNKGLTRFDPESGRFRTWRRRDGLQADEFNGGAFHRGAGGRLYFGGLAGFNAFHPAEIRDSEFAPTVVLTELQLAGRSLAPGDEVDGRVPLPRAVSRSEEIRLRHDDRVISLQFAALDLRNPSQNRYAYRLEGFDRGWHEVGADRRFATYTNLPPGRYRFRVRGTNCDGVWSPREAALAVVVEPPFWSTWWFRGAVAATAAGAALRSHRRRLRTVRLETELAAAREAQRSIWPQEDPRLPGYRIAALSRPASEVGGDFFDFVAGEDDPDVLWLAIGDVSGKGMRAAMTAVLSSGMTRAMVEPEGSPARILSALNRSLSRKLGPRTFSALCLARLAAGSGELAWSNAGLPEPILRRAGAAHLLSTPEPRLPLGVRPDTAYRQASVTLAPGDLLVLYSDGLPEALDRHDEPYGYERAAARVAALPAEDLSARQALDHLLDDVHRFRGGCPQADDLTLVVVQREWARTPPRRAGRRGWGKAPGGPRSHSDGPRREDPPC